MSLIAIPPTKWPALPDHTQLPDKDDAIVTNLQEPAQARLLTDALEPLLQHRHPDGRYCIGRDCGIYWRPTDPPALGCKAPDWFYVPNVPTLLEGQVRRSYVLWHEVVAPLIVLEFVSGSGSEERDRTEDSGKFWVYEQGIRVPFYGIYEAERERVEVYHLVDGSYALLAPNERDHFPISPLGVELGIWRGRFENLDLPWLRWWDAGGNLLLTAAERVELERLAKQQAQRQTEEERLAKEQAQRQAEEERLRAERLAAKLRALGVNPDEV
jgi:Uma2 family endonuclease